MARRTSIRRWSPRVSGRQPPWPRSRRSQRSGGTSPQQELFAGRALRCAPAFGGSPSGSPGRAAGKGLPALPSRFMESRHGSRTAHWDHEPGQVVGRALRCAPAFGGSPSGSPGRAAGKGLPALPSRFMESRVFQNLDTHWDHELRGDLPRRSRRSRRPEDLSSFVSFVIFVVQLRSWRGRFSKIWTRIGTLNWCRW